MPIQVTSDEGDVPSLILTGDPNPAETIAVSGDPGMVALLNDLGGFPRGAVTTVQGLAGSGKSVFLQAAIEIVLSLKHTVAYFDPEGSRRLVTDLRRGLHVFQPAVFEDLVEAIRGSIGGYDLIVINGINTLPTASEQPNARIRQMIPLLQSVTKDPRSALLVSYQTTRNSGGPVGTGNVLPREIQHLATLSLEILRGPTKGTFDIEVLKDRVGPSSGTIRFQPFEVQALPTVWDHILE